MYLIADFNRDVTLATLKSVNRRYATINAELTAIATALSSDTTKHGITIEKPPAALLIGPAQTPFTNDILHVVDKGKAGGLGTTAMSNAVTALQGTVLPPTNTTAPAVSGTGTVGNVLTCTMGTWTLAPSSYAYQWMRSGADIAGAVASTHTLVAADSGKNIACMVTASTAGGSAEAVSNAIACA
jgi:hypothetical protein